MLFFSTQPFLDCVLSHVLSCISIKKGEKLNHWLKSRLVDLKSFEFLIEIKKRWQNFCNLSYHDHQNPPSEDTFLDYFEKKKEAGKSRKVMTESYRCLCKVKFLTISNFTDFLQSPIKITIFI